jgi:hypothetical protein
VRRCESSVPDRAQAPRQLRTPTRYPKAECPHPAWQRVLSLPTCRGKSHLCFWTNPVTVARADNQPIICVRLARAR